MPRPRPGALALKPSGDGYLITGYDAHGRRVRVSAGQGHVVARQRLADYERASHPSAAAPRTLFDALSAYEAYARDQKKVRAYTRLVEAGQALSSAMGNLRIDQVDDTRWSQYAIDRRHKRTGRPVSPGTLKREFNVLRASLRYAVKLGHLDKPPAFSVVKDAPPRDRHLTKEEATRVLNVCVTPHVRVFVALLMYTGARRSAILGLTWDRVDLATGMIDFRDPSLPVTNKLRGIVPMVPNLRSILTEARSVRLCHYVVEYDAKPAPTGLRWPFRKACERAGLGWMPTAHHLRHSVASWFAMAGTPLDQVADWLAVDPKTLIRVYRKFDPTYLRGAAAALDSNRSGRTLPVR